MPFNANLEVDNKQFRIINCNYEMKRETDEFGKPTTPTRGGKITITIESSTEPIFAIWMTSEKMRKAGKIVFEDPLEDADYKTVEFTDAYMVKYKEEFGSDAVDSGMIETFTISAKELKIGDAKKENKWPK